MGVPNNARFINYIEKNNEISIILKKFPVFSNVFYSFKTNAEKGKK